VRQRPEGLPYYPIFLDLADRLCVVIGGGAVAERKARGLLDAGARVRLVSPQVTGGVRRLAAQGRIEVVPREYREGDLEGAALAIAATDAEEVNMRVHEESKRLSIPLNVADKPELCDFILPSVVRKGPVVVAISTSGLLPALARRLKEEIDSTLPADYGPYAKRVGAFRRILIENVHDPRRKREILRRVSEADVSEVARMTLKEMKKRFMDPRKAGESFSPTGRRSHPHFVPDCGSRKAKHGAPHIPTDVPRRAVPHENFMI
jgi:precorrin-2 dehydrogenase/sirohydrochlorin ferrochelatase